jgi:hypothetical protein
MVVVVVVVRQTCPCVKHQRMPWVSRKDVWMWQCKEAKMWRWEKPAQLPRVLWQEQSSWQLRLRLWVVPQQQGQQQHHHHSRR